MKGKAGQSCLSGRAAISAADGIRSERGEFSPPLPDNFRP